MASSPNEPGVYHPPMSLWNLVEQHVPSHEQDEIKNMLGDSLVELSLELHNEVNVLLDIWRDYKEETETGVQSAPKLPEPPHVRERLIQEICFLADSVREKSLRKGLDPASVLSRHNSQVLEYAKHAKKTGTSGDLSRPSSARSGDGRQTPISPSSIVNSHQNLSSTITENVALSNAKLNVLEFSDVCDRLRDTLEKEIVQLEADISFLQACLDDEAEFRQRGSIPAISRELTLTDLREERMLLEKELLSSETLPTTPSIHKPTFVPGKSGSIMTSNMTRLRPVHGISNNTKSSPLKATHNLGKLVIASQYPPSHFQDGTEVPDRAHGKQNKQQADNAPETASELVLKDFATGGPCVSSAHPETAQAKSSEKRSSKNLLGMKDKELFGGGGEGLSEVRRRNISPGRVKVVPVGSILDPLSGSSDSRQLIPMPPTQDKPQLRRSNSAERFRKLVMQCRDGT